MAEQKQDTFWKSLYIYFNEMDFQSQVYVKKLYKIIILTVAIISFIIAFFLERFSVCVYSTIGAGVFCVSSSMAYVEEELTKLVKSQMIINQMHINVRQSSKSRILLSLIDSYQKAPEDEAALEISKQNSVATIDKRFRKSEVNKNYIFPRTIIAEERIQTESPLFKQYSPKETPQNNFKELMKKIYLSNLKKGNSKTNLKPDFIKQQFSMLQKSHRKSTQTNTKTQLQHSLSQTKLLTDVGMKQSYSRGISPESKMFYTNRSISTQLAKFMHQRLKEKQSQLIISHQCKSFESKYQFSKERLQTKS